MEENDRSPNYEATTDEEEEEQPEDEDMPDEGGAEDDRASMMSELALNSLNMVNTEECN